MTLISALTVGVECEVMTMADLIDRETVLAEIEKFKILFNETGDSHERVAYASAEHCMLVIKAAPIIEAEPVRHGKWIRTGFTNIYGGIEVKCSACNYSVILSPERYRTIDESEAYCSHCGCRMRGDGNATD